MLFGDEYYKLCEANAVCVCVCVYIYIYLFIYLCNVEILAYFKEGMTYILFWNCNYNDHFHYHPFLVMQIYVYTIWLLQFI
jgi:hypothetical protein